MSEIITLLKVNSEMTATQLSQQLQISAKETISLLLNLEKENKVHQLNGYWFARMEKSGKNHGNGILPLRIIELINQWGTVCSTEISFMIGADQTSVNRSLNQLINNNKITSSRKGNINFYTINSN
ncbi:hypothetical protein M979_4409 [Buttiauxella noackiae ATCC 51607]|uniref:Uncharacterized protein n=1 Tax=Buttiauxella noackiae ATCC 51607 TaxID=1354255 RepID=A0A1B7HG87_9ENTR|nr:helix-turn-helix transcriptional regulator [Buttiauxella noackiae]OAT14639.1 hypothetical protein M979_4409 [Buttiauxella noackiae ATCC 51607]